MKKITMFLLLAVTLASAENLITNPGFEEWMFMGDFHLPVMWMTSDLTSPGSADSTTEVVHSGVYAIKLVGFDTMAFATTVSVITPNTAYRFGGWAQSTGGLAGTFSLNWLDSSFAVIGSPVLIPIIRSDEYRHYSLKCTAPESADAALIAILALQGEMLYVDDMALEPVNEIGETPRSDRVRLEVYPNPSSVRTGMTFIAGVDENFQLTLYDPLGRMVRRYYSFDRSPIHWDGRDEGGKRVTAGIYFVRVIAESFAINKKLTILP